MKNFTKTAAFFMGFALVVAFVSGYKVPEIAAATVGTTEGTHLTEVPAGYIGIYTKADLNNVRNNLSGKYILMNDIEFTDADFAEGGDFYNDGAGWIPIGSSFKNSFSGVFDGNNHIIKNLHINISSYSDVYAGLFGYIRAGKIQNLGITNCEVFVSKTTSTKSSSYIGIVVGYLSGTIDNCYTTGNLNTAAATTNDMVEVFVYSGGIAGFIDSGKISNCYNSGKIESFSSAPSGFYATCYAGGIVGRMSGSSNLYNCYKSGSVIVTSSNTWAAGIAGGGGSVSFCYNTGSVNATGHAVSAGGIIGSSGSAKNCYNTGEICATGGVGGVGGIVGHASGEFDAIVVENCYNTGRVLYNDTYDQVAAGGIAGFLSYCKLTSCYNIGDVSCTSPKAATGGIVGKIINNGTAGDSYYLNAFPKGVGQGSDATIKCTSEEMKQQITFVEFDFNTVWTMSGRADYPYPELQNVEMQYVKDPATDRQPTSTDTSSGAQSSTTDTSSGTQSSTTDTSSGTQSSTTDTSSGTQSSTTDTSSRTKDTSTNASSNTQDSTTNTSTGASTDTQISSTNTQSSTSNILTGTATDIETQTPETRNNGIPWWSLVVVGVLVLAIGFAVAFFIFKMPFKKDGK